MADPLYRRNKRTGQRAVSYDGGKTWELDDTPALSEAPPIGAGDRDPNAAPDPEYDAAYEAAMRDGSAAPASEPATANPLAPDYYDDHPMQVLASKPAPAAPRSGASPAYGYEDDPYAVGARNPWEGGARAVGAGYALASLGADPVETTRMRGRGMGAAVDPRSPYEIARDTEFDEQDAARNANGFQYGLGQGVTELAATAPLLATPLAGVPAANATARAVPLTLRAASGIAGVEGMGYGMLRGGLGSHSNTPEGMASDIAVGGIGGGVVGAATPGLLSLAARGAGAAVRPLQVAANEARSRQLLSGADYANVVKRPGMSLDDAIAFASEDIGAEAERRYGGGMQTAANYANKAGAELDTIGAKLGQVIDDAAAQVPDGVLTSDFIKRLRGATQARYADDTSSMGAANYRAYKRLIDTIDDKFKGKKYLSPRDLQDLKTTHAASGYPDKATAATPRGQQQLRDQRIAGVARRQLSDIILGDGTNPGLALPETQEAFTGLRNDYRTVKTIADAARQTASKPVPKVSPTQMAMGGMTGAGIGYGSTGSLMGAGIGAGAGVLAGAVPSAVRAKMPAAPAATYRALEMLAQRASGNLNPLARYSAATSPMRERLFGTALLDRFRSNDNEAPEPTPPVQQQPPPRSPVQMAGESRGGVSADAVRQLLDSDENALGEFGPSIREAIDSGDEMRINAALAKAQEDPEFRRRYGARFGGAQP